MVKGPVSVGNAGGDVSAKSPAAESKNSFDEVLKQKEVKGAAERLKTLIQGGASAETVVQTVVQENPFFEQLTPQGQEEMIQQLADVMRPLLTQKF